MKNNNTKSSSRFHRSITKQLRYLTSKSSVGLIWNVIKSDSILCFLYVLRVIVLIGETLIRAVIYWLFANVWFNNFTTPAYNRSFLSFAQPYLGFITLTIFRFARDSFDSLLTVMFSHRMYCVLSSRIINNKNKFFDTVHLSLINETFTDLVELSNNSIKEVFDTTQHFFFLAVDFITITQLMSQYKINKLSSDVRENMINEKATLNIDQAKYLDLNLDEIINNLKDVLKLMGWYTTRTSWILFGMALMFAFIVILLKIKEGKYYYQSRQAYASLLKTFNDTILNYSYISQHSAQNKFIILNHRMINRCMQAYKEYRVVETMSRAFATGFFISVMLSNMILMRIINGKIYGVDGFLSQYPDNKLLRSQLDNVLSNYSQGYSLAMRTILEDLYSIFEPISSIHTTLLRMNHAGVVLNIIKQDKSQIKRKNHSDDKIVSQEDDNIYVSGYAVENIKSHSKYRVSKEEQYMKCFAIENNLCYPSCKMKLHFDQEYHLYCKNITFNLSNRTILENFNFDISSKSNLYIVGCSGSGKSILLSIIMGRFECQEGEIYIERKMDGRVVETLYKNQINECCWNAHFNYVQQKNQLLSMSVKDNINFTSTRENAWFDYRSASKLAACYDFISRLPRQFNTIIGAENNFSGGQQQRICLSRVFTKKTIFYLMDEITSALDRISEKIVVNNIKKHISDGRITITHRLSEISNNDKVVFMDSGEIVDIGIHSELQANNLTYRNLCTVNIQEEQDEN